MEVTFRRPWGHKGKDFLEELRTAWDELIQLFEENSQLPIGVRLHEGFKMADVGPKAIPTEKRMALVECGDEWTETLERVRLAVKIVALTRKWDTEGVLARGPGEAKEILYYFQNWGMQIEHSGPHCLLAIKVSERGKAVWMTEKDFQEKWSQEAQDRNRLAHFKA